MRPLFVLILTCLAIPSLLVAPPASATFLPLPDSVAHDVLSETVPTAFAPDDFEAADYAIEWQGGVAPEGVQVTLGAKSLEWVRVMEVLAVPRARLRVEIAGGASGVILHGGFVTPMNLGSDGKTLSTELPVALISGAKAPVELRFSRGGKNLTAKLNFQFRPRIRSEVARIYRDPSCSRFGLQATASQMPDRDQSWAYIGCRLIVAEGAQTRTSVLELYVFWDGVGSTIQLNGAEVPESSASLWALRVGAMPGTAELAASGMSMKVTYRAAEKLKLGYLGLGIGPYLYQFGGVNDTKDTVVPMFTLYGSYFITEFLRLVAFDATTVGQNGSTDFGIYLNMENVRFIDRRLGINFLLGGHVLVFQTAGATYAKLGFPQGIEAVYSDAFGKGKNFSVGGFIYPLIDGKSYSNVWIRWGGSIFAELNYIHWRETIGISQVTAKSFGVTVGFPLARFL